MLPEDAKQPPVGAPVKPRRSRDFVGSSEEDDDDDDDDIDDDDDGTGGLCHPACRSHAATNGRLQV